MRSGINRARRPFWLPASNYYVLAVAVSTAFFFVVCGILHDSGEETPWVTAGISASLLLGGAVILRVVLVRREHIRFLHQQRVMDNQIRGVHSRTNDSGQPHKLTLEKNASILSEIKKKSDAANILNKFSAGHREVFELCSDYIARNESELSRVNPGSPRLGALLKGRSSVAEYHRYHLLRWAEIEARTLTNEAKYKANKDEKVESAQNALNVIESALESYPAEQTLIQSQELLRDMVVSIQVAQWVEKAERAAFKGNYDEAKTLYKDALFYLGRDNVQSHDRENAAMQINSEIERLEKLESGE
ncbi:MAG: hypothetical protein ABIP78_07470 [Pyrinomonadaceae bacterium]